MAQSFFIWNGIDCRAMGVTMRGPAPIIRPEERVRHIEIPGKSGDLTETEGDDIYNSYIQTASISVRDWARVREVYKWLRGAGFVTFSGEPDRQQRARIIGAITLNRFSRNLDKWQGEVQFYCQPLKEKLIENNVTISASGSTVRNNGDVICRPVYKVHTSATEVTLTVMPVDSVLPAGAGSNSITLSGVANSSYCYIDCETMEVWNSTMTSLVTKKSSGDFPIMMPGNNRITGSGWSDIEIEKRERYL